VRVLIISLNTYSSPYNDGKLKHLGPRLEGLVVVAGNATTLWGEENCARSGSGYEVVVLPLRFARSVATARLIGLDELADSVRPTVIHVEAEPWQEIAAQSVRIARRLKVPIGVHFAENGPRLGSTGGAIRKARGSWVLKHCDFAVGWSTASTRIAECLAPGIRTETFPATGISTTASGRFTEQWFGAESEHLPKLVFVGRFAREKGIQDFLEICDELACRLPIRAALAGGEDAYEIVHRWVAERPWALLHGVLPREKVSSLFMAADVLVCPSRTTRSVKEQFGKAAIEAMAVGTPVFAYDCGALSEVIATGGVVVPEGEQGELVDELQEYFAASANHRDGLAQEARRRAMQFADEVLAERLIKLWSTCGEPCP